MPFKVLYKHLSLKEVNQTYTWAET